MSCVYDGCVSLPVWSFSGALLFCSQAVKVTLGAGGGAGGVGGGTGGGAGGGTGGGAGVAGGRSGISAVYFSQSVSPKVISWV